MNIKQCILVITCVINACYGTEKKETSTTTAIIAGAIAGVAEGMSGVPCAAVQNHMQTGKTWRDAIKAVRKSSNPYRGIGTHIASMGPITALQAFTFVAAIQAMSDDISDTQKKGIAGIGAGIAAATVASPAEYIMFTQQTQSFPQNMIQASRTIITRHGIGGSMYGYTPTAIRDGIFTFSLFFGAPYDPTYGIGMGVFASIISHPFTTMRAKMYTSPTPISMIEATRKVIQEKGIRGCWKGLTPRATRITAAIPVMNFIQQKITPAVECGSQYIRGITSQPDA